MDLKVFMLPAAKADFSTLLVVEEIKSISETEQTEFSERDFMSITVCFYFEGDGAEILASHWECRRTQANA